MAQTRDEITRQILNNLQTWWKKTNDSNTYKLINSFSKSFNGFSIETDNLHLSIFVNTATGTDLDSLGKLFRLSRNSGETDTDFRLRITSYWQAFTGGGTVAAIKEAISQASGIDPSLIIVAETFTETGELHRYDSTQSTEVIVNNRDVIDASSVNITGTAGSSPYTFINGTDFIVEDGIIKFSQGGTNPDNGTLINVGYDYFSLLKFSPQVPLPPSPTPGLQQTIKEVIEQVKAAGIWARITWILSGGEMDEEVRIADTVSIITPGPPTGFFTIEVSYIEGDDVLV